MELNDDSFVVVDIVLWLSSITDDELDEEIEEERGTFEVDKWILLLLLVVVLRRRDADECSLLLLPPMCLSSKERKNARAFSTALFVDAECWNFFKDSIENKVIFSYNLIK